MRPLDHMVLSKLGSGCLLLEKGLLRARARATNTGTRSVHGLSRRKERQTCAGAHDSRQRAKRGGVRSSELRVFSLPRPYHADRPPIAAQKDSNPGLRLRNSRMCTLSQNGYGARQVNKPV